MKSNGIRMALALITTLALSGMTSPAFAGTSTSSQNSLVMESHQTAQTVAEEQSEVGQIQSKIGKFNSVIGNLNEDISKNQKQINASKQRLMALNRSVLQNQVQLNNDQNNLNATLRAMYENGQVSYLAVLFGATSFSDFIGRLQEVVFISNTENQIMQQDVSLENTLKTEKQAQDKTYQTLQTQMRADQSLMNVDSSLRSEEQNILLSVKVQLQSNKQNLASLESQLALSGELESQVQQGGSILSSDVPDVAVSSLRYQPISPNVLYQYVQMQGSTFSLQDIETICEAAKTYDVNPALLVAITGQEQSFVPPGPDADKIRNNPFNVFYSWQVYNTNLADAANIAADTLRHKLSAPPPAGENPILWINDPANPWGIYATDRHWAYGVDSIFNSIMQFVGSSVDE